eukprot:GHRQ01011346.1.p2 GENE.GHRQ01011346.1~~GHRQ01011346.1.p2  ORF type:complete len:282 (-),score=31.57 GHRQ01011346.1:43-888(-)
MHGLYETSYSYPVPQRACPATETCSLPSSICCEPGHHMLPRHRMLCPTPPQVPSAYKRNNQQRQPGWVDLPPLPPLSPDEIPAGPATGPNTTQPQQGWSDQPYTPNPAGNPGQAGAGFAPPADPGYQIQSPNFAPNKAPNRRNNNGGGGGAGAGGYLQPNGFPPLTDPFWSSPPPSQQNGNWARNRNNNFNRDAGFTGFDPTTEFLLQVGQAGCRLRAHSAVQRAASGMPVISRLLDDSELCHASQRCKQHAVACLRVLCECSVPSTFERSLATCAWTAAC